MDKHEKVIKGLECCGDQSDMRGYRCIHDCPYDFMNNVTCMGNLARDALELLKKQEQKFFVDSDGKITPLPIQPQWISVEDRLPDRYKKVLTYGTDYGLQENWLIRAGEEISWSMGYHITHWMPLPEPPEEVTQKYEQN